MLAALERADHAGAKALVKDLLAIAGITAVGGRDISEIADRFLEQAAERAEGGVGAEQQAILKRFLAISGDPDSGAAALRALASAAKLQISALVDLFEERVGFLAARGLPISEFHYDSGFVRDLDYYTGFVFEASDASAPEAKQQYVAFRRIAIRTWASSSTRSTVGLEPKSEAVGLLFTNTIVVLPIPSSRIPGWKCLRSATMSVRIPL